MAITLDGGINTVLFNLYLLRLGYGPDLVGAVNSVGMGVFAIACIPVGRLCERYSLLPIMRVGMVLIFIGSLFVPLVGWLPPTTHTAVLVMSAIISNLGFAAYFVAGAPYLGALSTIQQRTSIFSMQSATFAVFGFAGSLIGGNLPGLLANMGIGDINQPLPYQWTLWLVPIFLLVSLYLVSLMRDVNTNKLVVANKEANIIAANMNQTTEYYIIYKWNANDTKREGRYEAQFDLTFSDDGSKLIVPIREKLYINVLDSFVKSN